MTRSNEICEACGCAYPPNHNCGAKEWAAYQNFLLKQIMFRLENLISLTHDNKDRQQHEEEAQNRPNSTTRQGR